AEIEFQRVVRRVVLGAAGDADVDSAARAAQVDEEFPADGREADDRGLALRQYVGACVVEIPAGGNLKPEAVVEATAVVARGDVVRDAVDVTVPDVARQVRHEEADGEIARDALLEVNV